MRLPCPLALLAVAACAHPSYGVPTTRALPSPEERQREEIVACREDRWPSWLDDTALDEAARRDRFDAQGFQEFEQFGQATNAHVSSLPDKRTTDRGSGPEVNGVMNDRVAFRERCQARRAAEALPLEPGKKKGSGR